MASSPTPAGDPLDALPRPWRPGMSLRRESDGRAVGRFYGAELSSVFQPIVDAAGGRRIGFEAFIRCHARGEASLSPWSLFSLVADDDTLVALDRLCRTLHVLNDPRPGRDELLFLNVHGRLLAAVDEDHGRAFRGVLDALGMNPGRVVIETPESASREPGMLSAVLANYRLNGFRVAANAALRADAEGLLAHVRPDYLKLDSRHVNDPADRRQLHHLACEQGVRLVFTRVSDTQSLTSLQSLPAVLIQGHALGPPQPLWQNGCATTAA